MTAMAAFLPSPLSYSSTKLSSIPSVGHPKSSFISNPKLICSRKQRLAAPPRRRCYAAPRSSGENLDRIPKQFREENLEDGVKEKFRNVPERVYGLTRSEMQMFMSESSPFRRMAERATEESLSAKVNYPSGGMRRLSDFTKNGKTPSMVQGRSSSMLQASGMEKVRPRTPPPDMASLLLDARIVYLGLPTVPPVATLIVQELMWLDNDDSTKPIYMFINSSGSQDCNGQLIASEGDAYSIADCMCMCKAKIHTVNLGMAYGQAAMLLSLGTKGHRAVQPNSSTNLYLPSVYGSSGPVSDMWIKAKELDMNVSIYLKLLSKGTGKSEEELKNDIHIPKYFGAQEAIDYGLADKIVDPALFDELCEKRDYKELAKRPRRSRFNRS